MLRHASVRQVTPVREMAWAGLQLPFHGDPIDPVGIQLPEPVPSRHEWTAPYVGSAHPLGLDAAGSDP